MSLGFMTSARGHILRFLGKKRDGMFDALDIKKPGDRQTADRYFDGSGTARLEKLRAILVERGMSGDEFDHALVQLQSEGCIAGDALTDIGVDTHAAEYKAYLLDAKAKAPKADLKNDIDKVVSDVDVKHNAELAKRVK